VKKPRIGGAVYILPNLLTTGNLFWGFFAIMKALNHEFAWAGSAILLAAVFDVLDGRVARLTKGTSEFGVQYDSLCDLLSFGAAPAIIMHQYGLHMFGRIGWILCFLFMACGALRLARFNVQSSIGKASGDFTGLPIPMAAAVIATYVLFMNDLATNLGAESGWAADIYKAHLSGAQARANFLVLAAPCLSLAMVSNIVYRSHKALKVRGIRPFKLLAALVFVIALVAYQPEMVGFAACFLYALSGPFEWALGWKKPTEDDEIFAAEQDDSLIEGPAQQFDSDSPSSSNSLNQARPDGDARDMRRLGALTRDPSHSGGST
jgi:CDP-diacylglycerol--serine O-phosphatidyltransferase